MGRIMKKIRNGLVALCLLTGCGNLGMVKQQDKDVVLYLSQMDAGWYVEDDYDLYTALEIPTVDVVNERLQELQSGLHLTVKVCPSPDESADGKVMIENIKSNDPDADIVPFSQFAVSEYEPLDSMWEEDLNTYYSAKRLDTLRIHGHLMHFPKIIYPLVSPLVYVDENYYSQNQAILENVVREPMALLRYLCDSFEMQEDIILTDRIDFSSVVSDKYQNISDTFFYIRKEDGQVVDPYEEPELRNIIMLASNMRVAGVTGVGMDPAAYDKASSQMKFAIMTTMAYDDGEERAINGKLQFKAGHDEYCYEGGFSVLKDSDEKEDAYRLMHILLTDPECSELLQYGTEPKRDPSGKIEDNSHMRFGTWRVLGNNYLTESAVNEPDDKLNYYINKEEDSDVHEMNIYPTVFDLEEISSSLSKFEKIVSEAGDDMDIHACLACTVKTEYVPSTEEYMHKIDVLEERLQEAGIADVMAVLQEQVDGYEAQHS